MKRLAFAASLLILLASCNRGAHNDVTSVPGHGAISVQVSPNPIAAHHVSGDTYDFPFDVVVRETGGRPVNVSKVTVTVFAPGGFSLGGDSWDADKIHAMGFNTALNANGELRYHFNPRKSVTDDRVFGSITAELRVDATDESGTATSASTVVKVTKG